MCKSFAKHLINHFLQHRKVEMKHTLRNLRYQDYTKRWIRCKYGYGYGFYLFDVIVKMAAIFSRRMYFVFRWEIQTISIRFILKYPHERQGLYSSLKLSFYVQFCVFKSDDVFVDVNK